jgi:antitoxin ParD1/3/4
MQELATNISLKPEYMQLVKAQLESGRFASVDEVIGHALHLLDDQQDHDLLWLEETKEKIAIGLAQIDNGQVLEVSSVIERLKQKVQKAKDMQA